MEVLKVSDTSENMPYLEIAGVALVHCNIVNNNCQQKSYESCIHLFQIRHSVNYFTFLKILDSEFSYIEVWFTDENSKLLEIEDKINITLVIS